SRTWTSAGGERVAVSVGSAYPWSQLLGRMAVRSISLVSCLIAFALATPAPGAPSTTVAETFDGTLDKATWRLGTLDTIESTEGNPGAYLHNPQLDSAVPSPVYVGPVPSPFFGNYRAANVTSLGVDVIVYSASIGVANKRPVSLVLTSDMGTPNDPTD